ncbi:hypothetical protein F6V25_07530 [Oryzomonas japonica]|uniref:Uncharacterized protein n=1 Tax=Oryzomonas japonica TaxID=2603858 RepID=A0A7J4ZR48_9BACT|nr:hypothetical protein [Oryzomonas japonica]KAB0665566.1 hypothetical protein F6V25_07530 [Oryzomonas japonica]
MNVPRYDTPTVPVGPVATPQATPVGGEAFGSGLARGMEALSRSAADMADDMRRTVDQNFKIDALSDLLETKKELLTGADGALKTQGTDARAVELDDGTSVPLVDHVVGLYRAKKDEWLEKAATEGQKQMVSQLFVEHLPDLELQVMNHSAAQETLAADRKMEAFTARQYGLVADTPTMDSIRAAAQNMAQALATYPKYQGMEEAVRKEYDKKVVSQLHATAIRSLLTQAGTAGNSAVEDGKLAAAVGIFDAYYDVLNEREREELAPRIALADNSIQAGSIARKVWAAYAPKSPNDPFDTADANARIDGFTLSNEATLLAKAKVAQLFQDYRAQIEQRTQAAANAVNGLILDGGTYSQVYHKALEQRGSIPDSAVENMVRYAGLYFKDGAGKPQAALSDDAATLGRLKEFQDDYLNGKYGRLTPEQAGARMMPVLGERTPEAVRFVDGANADLPNARLAAGRLQEKLLALRGMDPDGTAYPALRGLAGNAPEAKGNRALLLQKIIGEITLLHDNVKPADLDGIIHRSIAAFIASPGYPWAAEKPVGAITDQDIRNMDDAALRAFVRRKLSAGGGKPTEAQIAYGVKRVRSPQGGK